MYALNMCVRLIFQVCQIQTLFVMLTALVDLFRQQLETAESMIDRLDGPPSQTILDEQWFRDAVAVMVITPIAIAGMLASAAACYRVFRAPHNAWTHTRRCDPRSKLHQAVSETLMPSINYWRECVATNPAFPPSATDFFLHGRTTSLPGHEKLTQAMPPQVMALLGDAFQDIEAEEFAGKVHRDLHHVIAETRVLAAVLYAPGDARLDSGDGRGPQQFPPPSMDVAFMAWLVKLSKYTHVYTCGQVRLRLSLDPKTQLEKELEAIEAVYPAVQEKHEAQRARIALLSNAGDVQSNRNDLRLHIDRCVQLKLRGGEKAPDPFVVAQLVERLADSGGGRVLCTRRTRRKFATRDPVFDEKMILPLPSLDRARLHLRLTVWDQYVASARATEHLRAATHEAFGFLPVLFSQ